jgi:hypothetical protein
MYAQIFFWVRHFASEEREGVKFCCLSPCRLAHRRRWPPTDAARRLKLPTDAACRPKSPTDARAKERQEREHCEVEVWVRGEEEQRQKEG